jgi:hypothetical protein
MVEGARSGARSPALGANRMGRGTRVALSQFALQAILLLIVWVHGCLGVHFWLRLKPTAPGCGLDY